ncbi:MAG: alkaline phosphatase family protein [Myxococcota bacterium]
MRARCIVGLLLVLAWGWGCTQQKAEREKRPRLVVIGIDGADWDILEPLVADGRMPTLAKLMARGSYGTLETIEPILSPIIWTTIATGRKPSEHGITWFMERDASGKTKPISSRLRKVPAVWNIASDAGLRVGVYGWWATWPSETISGYIVSDHVAAHGFGLTARNVDTEIGRTHPEKLVAEIEPLRIRPSQITDSEILEYMHITPPELATRRGDAMDFRNPLHHFLYALSAHKTYENIGRAMLARNDTDLSLHYFEATDSLSHLFMKFTEPPLEGIVEDQRKRFKDVVNGIYERQDRVLASLLEAAGPNANVIIVSDHGFKTGEARLVEEVHTSIRRAHEWHEKLGVILMSGPSIEQGSRLTASIYDVTPTMLYLLGLPAATTMPGRVLTEAIVEDELQRSPPREVVTYASPPKPAITEADAPTEPSAAEIDPDMLARLEALGYLDTTSTPEILLNRARTALNEGNTTQAIAVLEELLAGHPNYIDGELMLVQLVEAGGDKAAALIRWKAMSERPQLVNDGRVQRGYIQAMYNFGDKDTALARARTRVEEGRTEPLDWVLLAQLEARETGSPIDALERGTKTHPEDTGLKLELVDAQLAARDLDAARKTFERLPSETRSEPRAAVLRGRIQEAAGKPDEAIETWSAAAKSAPTALTPRILLGRTLMERRRFNEAEKWLVEAINLGAGPDVWLLRAQNAEASGNRGLAQRYAQKATQLRQR